jgi:hypothetical protein
VAGVLSPVSSDKVGAGGGALNSATGQSFQSRLCFSSMAAATFPEEYSNRHWWVSPISINRALFATDISKIQTALISRVIAASTKHR